MKPDRSHPLKNTKSPGKQIRAARALAGWEAGTLAKLAKISQTGLLQLERGEFRARPATADKIIGVFADAGIEFTENEGVRRTPIGIEIFEGHERFHEFTAYVFQHLKAHGGDVCISATDERLFNKYRKEPEQYRQSMKALVDSGTATIAIHTAVISHCVNRARNMRPSSKKLFPDDGVYAAVMAQKRHG